MEIDESETQ